MKSMTMLTNEQSNRHTYLDILKIISAFFIIFYHLGKLNFGDFYDSSYTPNLNRIIENINVVSIPCFFMVSGSLMLSRNYTSEKVYQKAAKIALLIFVWQFTEFPSWFFKTLIVIYLIYPVIIKIYNNKKFCTLLAIGLFVFPFLYNKIIVMLMKYNPDFSFNIVGREICLDTLPSITGLFTMYSILYLIVGAYLSNHKTNTFFGIFCLIIGILIVTLDGATLTNYYGKIYDSVNGCFPTIGALIASVGLFSIVKNIRVNNEKIIKIITFLGSRVLYTYLFHTIFIRKIIWKYFMTSDSYNFVVVLLVSVMVYTLSMLVGVVLEKIPLVKNLVKI